MCKDSVGGWAGEGRGNVYLCLDFCYYRGREAGRGERKFGMWYSFRKF